MRDQGCTLWDFYATMALTAAQRLAEAKAALHRLLLGEGVQSVTDQSGERVVFTTANVSRLKAYIAELEAEIAGNLPIGGPIRPMFF